MSGGDWLSTDEVADLLGVSVWSVRRLVRHHGLPCTKLHAHALRFERWRVVAWMRERALEVAS